MIPVLWKKKNLGVQVKFPELKYEFIILKGSHEPGSLTFGTLDSVIFLYVFSVIECHSTAMY